MVISGLEEANNVPGVFVYHAGTKVSADGYNVVCSGGRVVAVTGTGLTLAKAVKNAYSGASKVAFEDPSDKTKSLLHMRTDIAHRAMSRKLKVGVMGSTRGSALLPVIEAMQSGGLDIEIVAIVSNKEEAPILEKARTLGVKASYVKSTGLSREQFDAECTAELESAGANT